MFFGPRRRQQGVHSFWRAALALFTEPSFLYGPTEMSKFVRSAAAGLRCDAMPGKPGKPGKPGMITPL